MLTKQTQTQTKNPTKETPCANTQMGAQGIQRNERLAKQLIYVTVNRIKKLSMEQINFALNKDSGKGNPLLCHDGKPQVLVK